MWFLAIILNHATRGWQWSVPAGVCGDALGGLGEFLKDMEENSALRAGTTLRAMDRLRDALLRVEETASAKTPEPLLLQDASLLVRELLQRLR